MSDTLKIFSPNTVLRIRSKILEGGFEPALFGSPEAIADRLGGTLIDSGIAFRPEYSMEIPPLGSDDFDETDIINTEVIHTALPDLNPFDASRDEIWTTLCFGIYRPYVQRRYRPDSQQDKDLERNYRRRYLSSTVRNRWRDNAISRLWWLRTYAQRIMPENTQKALSVLFFRDKNLGETLLTKPSISAISSVGRAVIEHCYTRFVDPGEATYSRDSFRALIRDIDLESGRQLLATLDYEAVYEIIEERFDGVFGPNE
jgi:hypothetical protein